MKVRTFTDVKVYIDSKDILKQNVIYCLTLPNNKVYIGKTSRKLKDRIAQHCRDAMNKSSSSFDTYKARAIRKYLTFSVTILFEGEEDQLNDKEVQFIKECESTNPNIGYNLTEGGEGTTGNKCTKENKRKASKRFSKPVFQYDLFGNYIKAFPNSVIPSKELNILEGSIRKCCNGETKRAGLYQWRRTYSDRIDPAYKVVEQLDLDDIFVTEYYSTSNAGEQFGDKAYTSITDVCNGKFNTAFGFKWRWKL